MGCLDWRTKKVCCIFFFFIPPCWVEMEQLTCLETGLKELGLGLGYFVCVSSLFYHWVGYPVIKWGVQLLLCGWLQLISMHAKPDCSEKCKFIRAWNTMLQPIPFSCYFPCLAGVLSSSHLDGQSFSTCTEVNNLCEYSWWDYVINCLTGGNCV